MHRILIIDDEDDIREVAALSLETVAGWEVMVASSGAQGLARAATYQPDAILLDSGAGSGQAFEWRGVRSFLTETELPFIVAGGLSPENAGMAIRIFRPYGVDVVSGVESAPGKKDREKLKAFVTAVRNAEKEEWAAQH